MIHKTSLFNLLQESDKVRAGCGGFSYAKDEPDVRQHVCSQ
jgi:hypothetical protein